MNSSNSKLGPVHKQLWMKHFYMSSLRVKNSTQNTEDSTGWAVNTKPGGRSCTKASRSLRHKSSLMCVCVCVYMHTQSCLTLCNPMDCSPPGSSVHGILQARILEAKNTFPAPGDLPDPGIEPMSLASPASQVDSLGLSHLGSSQGSLLTVKFLVVQSVELLSVKTSSSTYLWWWCGPDCRNYRLNRDHFNFFSHSIFGLVSNLVVDRLICRAIEKW